MGAKVSKSDFDWLYTDEPHASRRKIIIQKYPIIKSLMKVDQNFKWIVVALVIFQIISLFFISKIESYLILFLLSYCLTGVINHALMLAVHEIAHGQAFGQNHIIKNRFFGMFANLPIGAPMSVSFKKYHLDHHRYQGNEKYDTDIPCRLEGLLFTTTFTKLLWVILQPLFYIFRPFFINLKPISLWEIANFIIEFIFLYFIHKLFGFKMILYLLFSTVIVMGLHPCAGHFIAEHYILFKKNKIEEENVIENMDKLKGNLLIPETSSYYGILNCVTFNVGYHVEHHDFPSIPGSKLPLVRKIAPEFYNHLNYHNSWSYVLWQYIVDPSIGPYSRVKRKNNKYLEKNSIYNNEDYKYTIKSNGEHLNELKD